MCEANVFPCFNDSYISKYFVKWSHEKVINWIYNSAIENNVKIMLAHRTKPKENKVPNASLGTTTSKLLPKSILKGEQQNNPYFVTWSCHNAVQSNLVWIFKIITVCHVMVPFCLLKISFLFTFTSGKMRLHHFHTFKNDDSY